MERHFYFFRHGQTNENEVGVRYGTGIDAWLTDLGVTQATKLHEFFKDKNIQIVYSSPYRRAIDTAKIAITNDTDIEIIIKDSLKEAIFWFWNTENEDTKRQIEENFKIIKNCLDEIIKTDNRHSIAIASHGGVTRALCWACGLKVEGVQNAQCFHFVLDENGWKYIETFIP